MYKFMLPLLVIGMGIHLGCVSKPLVWLPNFDGLRWEPQVAELEGPFRTAREQGKNLRHETIPIETTSGERYTCGAFPYGVACWKGKDSHWETKAYGRKTLSAISYLVPLGERATCKIAEQRIGGLLRPSDWTFVDGKAGAQGVKPALGAFNDGETGWRQQREFRWDANASSTHSASRISIICEQHESGHHRIQIYILRKQPAG